MTHVIPLPLRSIRATSEGIGGTLHQRRDDGDHHRHHERNPQHPRSQNERPPNNIPCPLKSSIWRG